MNRGVLLACGAGVVCILLLLISAASSFIDHRWTKYPPGFSHRGWKQITNGMPAATLRSVVGNPFGINDHGQGVERWVYSRGNAAVFRRHDVTVSNGVVVGVYDALYFD